MTDTIGRNCMKILATPWRRFTTYVRQYERLVLRQASTDGSNRHPTTGSTHQFRLAKALDGGITDTARRVAV